MNWPERSEEIQRLYFRTGPYTYLWMKYDHSSQQLVWCFTFMDLGMCHSISSHTVVFCDGNGMFCVDGENWVSETQALASVFDGHYTRFVWDLYTDMGIEADVQNIF
jgi:hypothetical protein